MPVQVPVLQASVGPHLVLKSLYKRSAPAAVVAVVAVVMGVEGQPRQGGVYTKKAVAMHYVGGSHHGYVITWIAQPYTRSLTFQRDMVGIIAHGKVICDPLQQKVP